MNDWIHRFGGYDPADERRREALCTFRNGYFSGNKPHGTVVEFRAPIGD
jgi:hypothetical protein